MRFAIALPEKIMFELRRGECVVAELFRVFELAAQDRARSDRDVLVGFFILEIAQDESALLEPARDAQRAEIGDEVEVTVSELPVGEFVTGNRLHLHVRREEVVAAVRPAVDDIFHEHFGIETLAEEAPVMVGEADDDRLDIAVGDELAQFVELQHALDGFALGQNSLPGLASGGPSVKQLSGRVISSWG
jgi:hypothetical protein